MLLATLASSPFSVRARGIAAWARTCALLVIAAASTAAPASVRAEGAPTMSLAERLLFMNEPPLTLNYRFRKAGALEPGFDDRVAIDLRAAPDGSCCAASGRFLSGPRAVMLPDIEQARANPVLLYFLEHDVRDMNRLTKGAPAYFRKRIRLAIADDAKVSDVTLQYQGRSVAGRLIEIEPYRNDPTRQRYARYADKAYQFFVSDAVPGGVYGVRTVMRAAAAGEAPLIIEQLFIEGGSAPADSPATETPRS